MLNTYDSGLLLSSSAAAHFVAVITASGRKVIERGE